MDKYEARFWIKRAAGIPAVRGDKSSRTPENDRQSGYAEEYAANVLGGIVDDSVTVHGDDGYDFKINVQLPSGRQATLRVGAVWNGFKSGSTYSPRNIGNLIINDDEWRYRNTHIFVLVVGTTNHGFELMGWANWDDVKLRPKRFFGKNEGRKFYVPMHELRRMELLKVVNKCVI